MDVFLDFQEVDEVVNIEFQKPLKIVREELRD